jgi:glycine cleavage system H protein
MHVLGFEYPDALYFWLAQDLWCAPQADGSVRVGISAFGVHLSGDFYMARPKPVGTQLVQGQTLAVVELSKSIIAIKTPVSGTVCAVNPLLEETPELIHQDPYGRGWLAALRPSQWQDDLAQLHHGGAVTAAATERMRREPPDALR